VSSPDLNQDFRDLLTLLADESASFLLIGGWALALHGYGRGTDDMDIFVQPTQENAGRVFRALAAFGAPIAEHGITEGLFAQEGYGYRMGKKPNLIEILTRIDGISFDEAFKNHRVATIDGRAVPYMGRAALLKNKLAAGRAKDLADVEWLRKHPEEA